MEKAPKTRGAAEYFIIRDLLSARFVSRLVYVTLCAWLSNFYEDVYAFVLKIFFLCSYLSVYS